MMLHRHFENDAPKVVTRLTDVTPKATAPAAEPEVKPAAQTAKKPGRPKSK